MNVCNHVCSVNGSVRNSTPSPVVPHSGALSLATSGQHNSVKSEPVSPRSRDTPSQHHLLRPSSASPLPPQSHLSPNNASIAGMVPLSLQVNVQDDGPNAKRSRLSVPAALNMNKGPWMQS